MQQDNEHSQPLLPAASTGGSFKTLPAPSYQTNSYSEAPSANENEPQARPLAHYLWVIRRHRWQIASFVLASVVLAFVVTKRMVPVYQSTATIDVDRQEPQGVVGQDSARTANTDIEPFLATQLKLIQSDAVLRPVAQKYNLLHAEQQLPAARDAIARLEDAPVRLKRMVVERPPNTFLIQISYRSANPQLAADVANAIARSYIETSYNTRFRSSAELSSFMEKQLEELKAKVESSAEALGRFERDLSVINPEEKTNILSTRLLQLNTEYTNAQADRVKKEAGWRSVKSGTLESAEISGQGDALKNITDRLSDAQRTFAEVQTRFGANHPEYKKAASQVAELRAELDSARQHAAQRVGAEYNEAVVREEMLQKAVSESKAEYDGLNARSVQYQALKREADADKKLYEELIQRIKEAGINSGFQGDALRLADLARPAARPVSPVLTLNLILAFAISLVFSVGAALAADMMDNTVRDPEQVQRLLNTQVVGILPHARTPRRILGSNGGDNGSKVLMRLADVSNKHVGGYIEAIRTLRNSILLGNLDRGLSSLLVTSAAPREGKTTTAVHLALAHAEQRHKTLLIDCDLRRPAVHKYFDFSKDSPGVSNIVTEGLDWRTTIQRVESIPDLHIITAGPSSRLAADLLDHAIPQIIAEANNDYALVVIDAPPVLGFAECLQLSTAVDSVLVVTLAGETNRRALMSVLETLKRLHARISGVVLNRMAKDITDGYYYYGYYGKYYYHDAPNNKS